MNRLHLLPRYAQNLYTSYGSNWIESQDSYSYNAKDENVKCPRCLEYNLPKYYPGALGFWYVNRMMTNIDALSGTFGSPKDNFMVAVSNYNDELCSPCGDDEAGQARMEQANMTTEELGMLRDWLILSKDERDEILGEYDHD